MIKHYDPKLREAAEEFKALCKKYDCMAVTLLVSPTHAEFVNHISPTWSLMRFEIPLERNSYAAIRFRSKRADFPTKEAQDAATLATTHGVTSIVEWSRMIHTNWTQLLDMLRQHMVVLHKAWGRPDSVPGDGQ